MAEKPVLQMYMAESLPPVAVAHCSPYLSYLAVARLGTSTSAEVIHYFSLTEKRGRPYSGLADFEVSSCHQPFIRLVPSSKFSL
ncbi:hypothetical protein Y1Q_0013201 [Alligator mississippiensis]|uniref:Uncharacterized protein n=1 Tax=Alligator mississippiensis TaxID=8496 RepID=A0A151NUD5_ALLMI|nr:hypothetical protein Y1Q_0013201 [Alligator mississippiensis]